MSAMDEHGAKDAAPEHVDVTALLQVLPDAAVHADLTACTMIEVNAAFEDMTGYGRQDLRGAALDLLLPDEAVHGIAVKAWAKLLEAPGLHEEVPLRRRDGSCFVGTVSVSLLEGPAGRALLFVRDPTARRLLERELITKHKALREAYEELEATNERLQVKNRELAAAQSVLSHLEQMATIGRFAAGVAHEVNNPLAFVLENLRLLQEHAGYLQPLLEREVARAPSLRLRRVASELQELLVDSLQGAERVRNIVRQLRAFSNTEDRNLAPVDMAVVAESAITMVQNQIRQVARLERDYVEVPPILGISGQLVQVVVNLLVNALHAIEEGKEGSGRVFVRIRPRASDVVLELEDSGVGIPPHHLGRVFEPFFTTKRAGKGTGLGLSISARIMQQHEGRFEVDSQLGRGTTVRLVLPAITAMPMAIQPNVTPTTSSRRAKLLFVDDEELLLRALGRRYRAEHDVSVARSPQEVWSLLDDGGRFDLVIVDMMMPELSGPKLLEQMLDRHSWLRGRVAFMSGGAFGDEVLELAERLGVPILEKPIDPESLQSLIVNLSSAP